VRELLLGYPGSFITPRFCIEEIWEHRDVWERGCCDDEELREVIDLLAADILVVAPEGVYSSKAEEARFLTDDPDDIPVIALALAIDNDGLWTFNKKDFAKPALRSRIKILGTSEVCRLLRF
jgi:predicted nucleic acid-binding protein